MGDGKNTFGPITGFINVRLIYGIVAGVKTRTQNVTTGPLRLPWFYCARGSREQDNNSWGRSLRPEQPQFRIERHLYKVRLKYDPFCFQRIKVCKVIALYLSRRDHKNVLRPLLAVLESPHKYEQRTLHISSDYYNCTPYQQQHHGSSALVYVLYSTQHLLRLITNKNKKSALCLLVNLTLFREELTHFSKMENPRNNHQQCT